MDRTVSRMLNPTISNRHGLYLHPSKESQESSSEKKALFADAKSFIEGAGVLWIGKPPNPSNLKDF